MGELHQVDFAEGKGTTGSRNGKRFWTPAGRQFCSAPVGSSTGLRLESKSCAVEFYPIRHRVRERGHQYATALDYQARKRPLHSMESRLATHCDRSACQHRSRERPGRNKTAMDVSPVKGFS